jgi:hypothetical protein
MYDSYPTDEADKTPADYYFRDLISVTKPHLRTHIFSHNRLDTEAFKAWKEEVNKDNKGFLVRQDRSEMFEGIKHTGHHVYDLATDHFHLCKLKGNHRVVVRYRIVPGMIGLPHRELQIWFPFKTRKQMAEIHRTVTLAEPKKHEISKTQTVPDIEIRRIFNSSKGVTSSYEFKPGRPLSSIVLMGGQLEEIMESLRKFSQSEDAYKKLGVPFKYVLLLDGEPGTGKTSLAKAIATEFRKRLVQLDLSGAKATDFGDYLSLIPTRGGSVVLIEDFDVQGASTDRSGNPNNDAIQLSQLLNFFDGATTPEKCVFILTSNHPEKFDKALLRPGRVDHRVTLTGVPWEQGKQVFNNFLDSAEWTDDRSGLYEARFPDKNKLCNQSHIQALAQETIFGRVVMEAPIATPVKEKKEDPLGLGFAVINFEPKTGSEKLKQALDDLRENTKKASARYFADHIVKSASTFTSPSKRK